MAHDPEAIKIILTTLRTHERDPQSSKGATTAEEYAEAILSAFDCEGFHVVPVTNA